MGNGVRNGRVRAGLLGVEHTTVERVELDEDEQLLVAHVRPIRWRRRRCGICQRRCRGDDPGRRSAALAGVGSGHGAGRMTPARTSTNSGAISYPYRCSRLPRCSARALFSVAYIAERDRPLMSISCAALYSPDS